MMRCHPKFPDAKTFHSQSALPRNTCSQLSRATAIKTLRMSNIDQQYVTLGCHIDTSD